MKKQVKIYNPFTDPKAIHQFYEAMELDCSVKGALMPDAHLGYSLPIGGVIATEGKIFPSWVGYDIGCGMCALKTDFRYSDVVDHAKEIFDRIYALIPVGFNHRQNALDFNIENGSKAFKDIYNDKKGGTHLGTLGGGNHFIEIGVGDHYEVWIIIHSGSRGVGHGVAQHYMRKASNSAKAREGHYGLNVDGIMGQYYIADMNLCLDFALENRKSMMKQVVYILSNYFGKTNQSYKDMINRNHNHAELKDGLWIHRKGATHAEREMSGVIPGNMRDGSFIVKGKGNEDALCSSSHGAGRAFGRAEAKKKISMGLFEKQMEGIIAKVDSSTKDESPDAYHNIYDVMDFQTDLVEIVDHIKPIINIKG